MSPPPTDTAAAYRGHLSEGQAKLAGMLGAGVESRADGCYVTDERDKRYLDFGGFGVLLLGHRHPTVVRAVMDQLDRQTTPTRLLLNPILAEAAERLASIAPSGLGFSYFTSSGAEATELAIKLGRLAGRRRLVAMSGGFHGKTLGALSLAGDARYRDPFEPLGAEAERARYGDAPDLESVLAGSPGECCVFLEAIQGEGGVVIPPPGYLKEVEQMCRAYDALLVVDEIQTGLGRTGVRWAMDREDVVPDIMLAGKALGGGVVPIGAVLATERVFGPLSRDPYLHSSTFGNNPLAAAAALASIDAIEGGGMAERAEALGRQLLDLAGRVLSENCPDLVSDVRGRGLLIGIEFAAPQLAGEFVNALFSAGVLTSFALGAHSVVRLTPPAILEEEELAWFQSALETSAKALYSLFPSVPGGENADR